MFPQKKNLQWDLPDFQRWNKEETESTGKIKVVKNHESSMVGSEKKYNIIYKKTHGNDGGPSGRHSYVYDNSR